MSDGTADGVDDDIDGAASDPSRCGTRVLDAKIAEGLTSEDAAVACGVSGRK